MKRQKLWGGFSSVANDENMSKQIEIDHEIMNEKRGELKILKSSVFFEPKEKHIKMLSRNETVNQTIGLKQKKQMIQELIDTSTDNNFSQILPTLKDSLDSLPTEIPTPNYNDKFNKICFIPPVKNDFTTGKPRDVQKVNKTCVQHAMRKSICGLTRLTDYTDVNESALMMFNDAVHLFYKSLMESIVTVLTNDDRETETEIDIVTFERAYFALTGDSTTTFFNYFKREIQDKHQQTVSEFKSKVNELKAIVDNQHQSIFNDIQPDFYHHNFFTIKEEIKQEYDEQ